MVRSAVILAAGRGVRLGASGSSLPKGFIRIGAQPIIAESLARLRRGGIGRVVVVTGHCHEFYDSLAAAISAVVTVHNPNYADSGTLHSLSYARPLVDEDFLLLESDLVYEQRAIGALLAAQTPDAILLSGLTGADDAVFVETDAGAVRAMSKRREGLTGVGGELVGISRISLPLLNALMAYAAAAPEGGRHCSYETDGLTAVARERTLPALVVPDLIWGEIDDAEHLRRARDTLYPAIMARDGSQAMSA
jgi:choline kinase